MAVSRKRLPKAKSGDVEADNTSRSSESPVESQKMQQTLARAFSEQSGSLSSNISKLSGDIKNLQQAISQQVRSTNALIKTMSGRDLRGSFMNDRVERWSDKSGPDRSFGSRSGGGGFGRGYGAMSLGVMGFGYGAAAEGGFGLGGNLSSLLPSRRNRDASDSLGSRSNEMRSSGSGESNTEREEESDRMMAQQNQLLAQIVENTKGLGSKIAGGASMVPAPAAPGGGGGGSGVAGGLWNLAKSAGRKILGRGAVQGAATVAGGAAAAEGAAVAGGAAAAEGAAVAGGTAATGGMAAALLPAAAMAAGGYAVGKVGKWGSDKLKAAGYEKTGKAVGVGSRAAQGALYGAAIGTLIPIPGVSTAVGAAVGGLAGAAYGAYENFFGGDKESSKQDDTSTMSTSGEGKAALKIKITEDDSTYTVEVEGTPIFDYSPGGNGGDHNMIELESKARAKVAAKKALKDKYKLKNAALSNIQESQFEMSLSVGRGKKDFFTATYVLYKSDTERAKKDVKKSEGKTGKKNNKVAGGGKSKPGLLGRMGGAISGFASGALGLAKSALGTASKYALISGAAGAFLGPEGALGAAVIGGGVGLIKGTYDWFTGNDKETADPASKDASNDEKTSSTKGLKTTITEDTENVYCKVEGKLRGLSMNISYAMNDARKRSKAAAQAAFKQKYKIDSAALSNIKLHEQHIEKGEPFEITYSLSKEYIKKDASGEPSKRGKRGKNGAPSKIGRSDSDTDKAKAAIAERYPSLEKKDPELYAETVKVLSDYPASAIDDIGMQDEAKNEAELTLKTRRMTKATGRGKGNLLGGEAYKGPGHRLSKRQMAAIGFGHEQGSNYDPEIEAQYAKQIKKKHGHADKVAKSSAEVAAGDRAPQQAAPAQVNAPVTTINNNSSAVYPDKRSARNPESSYQRYSTDARFA